MKRPLTLCVVAALLALAVAPTATVAQAGGPQPTTTAPENSTTTSAPGDGANNTTDRLDAERVIDLIETGRAWADRERITAWLAAHGDRLDTSQAATAYEWLLTQTADADTSLGNATDALDTVTQTLPQERARAVLDRVRDQLPSADVDRLRARLDDVHADWSAAVSGWLSDDGSTTTPPTTAPPTTAPATTPPTDRSATTGGGETANSGERIDADLRLISSSYDGEGTATLVFETDG